MVDAPMIGVRVNENTKELAFLPWIRVIRNEYSEGSHSWDKGKAFAIDIVHKDFLQDYVEKYTLSFAREFSHLAVKHDKVLASGAGFVSGLWKNGLQDIEKN